MTMHVLQLGPYPPPEGGVTRNMLAIKDELLSLGHRCTIIATSKSTGRSTEQDVYHPRTWVTLLRLLASLNYDVLHLHIGGKIGPRVLAMAFACTVFGRHRCVLTVHSGGWPLTDAARTASPGTYAARIFRRFTRVIAVNQAIADVFYRYGVDAERAIVVPPYALSPPSSEVRVPNDLAMFCKASEPMLLAVGGLEPDYEPLLQIEALGEIIKQRPKAGLMIVGGGSLSEAVKQYVSTLPYADSVKLADNVSHDIVLHLIRDADVMLRTTRFDGDAISVREALFLGTPVIATHNSIRPEGVTLIKPGDREAMVNAVLSLPDTRRPHAIPPPDNTNIRQIVDLYTQILGTI